MKVFLEIDLDIRCLKQGGGVSAKELMFYFDICIVVVLIHYLHALEDVDGEKKKGISSSNHYFNNIFSSHLPHCLLL